MVFENQRLRLEGRMYHLRIRVLWCKASIIKSCISVAVHQDQDEDLQCDSGDQRTPNSKYDLTERKIKLKLAIVRSGLFTTLRLFNFALCVPAFRTNPDPYTDEDVLCSDKSTRLFILNLSVLGLDPRNPIRAARPTPDDADFWKNQQGLSFEDLVEIGDLL